MFVTNASSFSDPPHWSGKAGLVKRPCMLTRLGCLWVVLSHPSRGDFSGWVQAGAKVPGTEALELRIGLAVLRGLPSLLLGRVCGRQTGKRL